MYENLNIVRVADVEEQDRARFLQKTYNHLAGAILVFIALEVLLLNLPFTPYFVGLVFGYNYGWLIVLVAFMLVSYIAEQWAMSDVSKGQQYAGLILYVVAEAIIFVPILYIAKYYARDPYIIQKAGVMTLLLFFALTLVAFTTKKDFSFLGAILKIASFVAAGFIIASMIFGFSLGNLFAAAMVVFAGGCILYDTSNVIHHFRTDQYVAASLSLFASVALMFWYILRLFLSRDR